MMLKGLKILDLTRVMAGPFCTALLADLGAEVIKLEPPQGDDYRHIGPFVQGESALFTLMNRGKQSIVLDLKDADAQATAPMKKRTLECVFLWPQRAFTWRSRAPSPGTCWLSLIHI